MVKALPQLVKRFPGLRYQMIGEVRDESYVRYLHRLAHDLGVSHHLIITPDLDNATKLRILGETDVYIQPSHEEGFCLAYAEAAAMVARLVGTDTGAIASMSVGDAGARVVPVKTPSKIVSAIEELISTEMPQVLMSEQANRMNERSSPASYIGLHEEFYRSLRRLPT